tara:strand:- start:949 stop:2778 length:1830 start_codon:yes stop_codon:yes gene_type:complete
MATTIKSSALDFANIKNNLKTFLQKKEEFKDYNFEASGLSNMLDVLAYNTHLNGLTANFALNESFLSTAQLRSSLVQLSEAIGYIPKSKTASQAIIKMAMNLSNVADRQQTITISTGYKFTTKVDVNVYTFQTNETLIASDDGAGYYQFKTLDGNDKISVFEGSAKTKTFISGDNDENAVYIIPDKNIDISTAIVKVYENASTSKFVTYTNITKATTISEQSTLYILKEMPNGYFELSFGNGTTLGQTPDSGSKITVEYLAVNGANADNALTFEPSSLIKITETINRTPVVSTYTKSVGGGEKETVESIRKNAPFQYASQNRMVTFADYNSLILRNYATLIEDISSWGGEDNLKPEFGVIFSSIEFEDDVSEQRKEVVKTGIVDLASQLAVATFDIKFSDPVKTWVETEVFFRFNPSLTSLSLNTIQENVRTAVQTYFSNSVGKFEQAFRRSNMLTLVDDVSPSILSSRAEVKMQQRFAPSLLVEQDHSFSFPSAIASPDDVLYRVTSSTFVFRNENCQVRNKLNSTKLQVINLTSNKPIVDNVGQYNPDAGTVSIVGLQVDTVIGGVNYIKLATVPANQSAIVPEKQYILNFDNARSIARAVVTKADN